MKQQVLFTTIQSGDCTVKNVRCTFTIPVRLSDPLELCFAPTREQADLLGFPFKFSVSGQIEDSEGRPVFAIHADKVFQKYGGSTQWGPAIREYVILGDPHDLTVDDLWNPSGVDTFQAAKGSFWLTPNIFLAPDKFLLLKITGASKILKHRCIRFQLLNGTKVTFDTHYRSIDHEEGSLRVPELVAVFELASKERVPETLTLLDDLLLLVSFAARQRCVCLGWDAADSSGLTRYFRRSMRAPTIRKDHSFNEALILPEDFKKFIRCTYRRFATSPQQDLLRQALQRLVFDEDSIFDHSFLRLYSAVETLVFFFRGKNAPEEVLSAERWEPIKKELEKELRKFLKSHNLSSNERKLMYEKLPELNRVAFTTALQEFLSKYPVELSDLWPLASAGPNAISLSDIRHRLVHGDWINPEENRALAIALEHLRWTAERLTLATLGWPIEKSRVYLLEEMANADFQRESQQAMTFLASRWKRTNS
ncbi:MAG: hypothetical protein KGL31_04475 [candidate division NC10 bacterium]|nr:hypothetical protein [candidate division NC10 bacterium]MDE2321157.1 hypothetical protein [candidate division NC10 bacterium]